MRTVVKSRASLLLTLVIIVFLVTARGETTPVKEAKAQIIYHASSGKPARRGTPYTRGCGSHYYCRPPSTPPPPPPPPPSTP
ncbi:unnamed protein product [Musa hybrid cultivar]